MRPNSLFGTDGIRGPVGEYPLDQDTVVDIGFAVAKALLPLDSHPIIVMGGDTRQSSPVLASWLASGLRAGGVDVRWAGVIPTPGVAFLVREYNATSGIVLSASHNPFSDNGIKLINAAGQKWSREQELRVENLIDGDSIQIESQPQALNETPGLTAPYEAFLGAILPGERPLAGLRICLDLANGAATPFAENLFRSMGAHVETLFDRPNGLNINAGCGSTAPDELAAATRDLQCDLGIAFDGDADRALLVDELGSVWDGDAILMLWALALQRQGELIPPRIVATTMSNLGLQVILAEHEIELVRCDVGDRQVVEAMQRERAVLGGEQSGHIIQANLMTTGDGLLTGLQMAHEVRRSSEPLSAMLSRFPHYPQVLRSLKVTSKPDLLSVPSILAAVQAAERALGDNGRLVLRYSGTEPLVRVMIEGSDRGQVEVLVEELVRMIGAEIGE